MALKALIGALRVTLAIDTAQFDAGLDKARGKLGDFGKMLPGLLTAGAAAAATAAVALGVATKGAIDYADAIDEAAQKSGVGAKALSRLAYAAKVEGVSLEGLTTSLGRLSRGIAETAEGSKGPAASGFAALGISVTDAKGRLRDADAVFVDVADRLSRMEDGSQKTALSMAVFGKSGAELLPILNHGRAGLAAMADESDRLGQTISGETAAAAGQFNDTLTKLQAGATGVVNRIAAGVLPALNSIADTLTDPGFGAAVTGFTNHVLGGLNAIMQGAANAANNLRMLRDAFSGVEEMSSEGLDGRMRELGLKMLELENRRVGTQTRLDTGDDLFGINRGALQSQLVTIAEEKAALIGEQQKILDILAGRNSDGEGTSFTPDTVPAFVADMTALTDSTTAAKDAADALKATMAEGLAVFEATRDPLEQTQMQLDKLGHLLNQGAIDWDTYSRAVHRAKTDSVAEALGMAGQITGALSGIFQDNKAFAVANAVVNTAEGVTKALAQGGIWGFAGAAAVAASGAAQIAAILSANPGSASPVGVGAAPSAAAPEATPGRSGTIVLQGDSFNRNSVRDLLRDMQEMLGVDGQQLAIVDRGA